MSDRPDSYDALYREYHQRVLDAMTKAARGAYYSDDASSELWRRCIETDVLKRYDPSRGISFNTFFMRYIYASARGLIQEARRIANREPTAGDTYDDQFGTYSLNAPYYDRVIERLSAQETLLKIRKHFAEKPRDRGASKATPTYLEAFDALVWCFYNDPGHVWKQTKGEGLPVTSTVASERLGSSIHVALRLLHGVMDDMERFKDDDGI